MGAPVTLTVSGKASLAPSVSSSTTPSGTGGMSGTIVSRTYLKGKTRHGVDIVGATDGSPFVVEFEDITSVRYFLLRVSSGTIKVRLTSAVAALQEFNVSDKFEIHNPVAGDEFTAIALVGTACVEYMLAGD